MSPTGSLPSSTLLGESRLQNLQIKIYHWHELALLPKIPHEPQNGHAPFEFHLIYRWSNMISLLSVCRLNPQISSRKNPEEGAAPRFPEIGQGSSNCHCIRKGTVSWGQGPLVQEGMRCDVKDISKSWKLNFIFHYHFKTKALNRYPKFDIIRWKWLSIIIR